MVFLILDNSTYLIKNNKDKSLFSKNFYVLLHIAGK